MFHQSQCTRWFPIQGGSVTGWVLENSLYKKGVPPSHHLMGNATVETSITTWPPLMCVSVLIVCFENKHGQSYLLLKVIVTTTFQWLFAEGFFHHQDGLKSRTLFVIPHKFFWGIMLSSFLKRMTPYSPINQVQVQTKQIQVVEVSKHTQTTKYAPRDSTFSFVMLSLTSPKLGLMKKFDPFLKKSDMNANERSGSCDSKRPFFYLPGLHCRGSFEMLAVIPASNEWCRIGSCCLSMFELWLSKSCFTKVRAPVDSPLRQVLWQDKFKPFSIT